MNGKKVYEGIIHVIPGPNSYKIDVSYFRPGEYIVNISQPGKQQSIKFIKQ